MDIKIGVELTKINVVNKQSDLFHYIAIVTINGEIFINEYYSSFKEIKTADKVISLLSGYNSRDGKFQGKFLTYVHKLNNIPITFNENNKDTYSVDYGKLQKI